MAESQADVLALRELGECVRALHGARASLSLTNAREKRADFDALRREFAALHDDLEVLHAQDMGGNVDRDAHRSWRDRVWHLAANLVGFVE